MTGTLARPAGTGPRTAAGTRAAAATATAAEPDDRPGVLLDLATGWLSAEVASVREPGRTELVGVAGERAGAYEAALAAATAQDVRLAWEQAVVRQAREEVGSAAWSAASRVSELLRFEDRAAREGPGR